MQGVDLSYGTAADAFVNGQRLSGAEAGLPAAITKVAVPEAHRRLIVPWDPMLAAEDVRRGLTYYGSGKRLQAVAAKLLSGEPIKLFTLGGSVTKGQGASSTKAAYPYRLSEFINATFPHRCGAAPRSRRVCSPCVAWHASEACVCARLSGMAALQPGVAASPVGCGCLTAAAHARLRSACSGHTFVNKGVGATSSGIFTACVEKMVEPVSGGRAGGLAGWGPGPESITHTGRVHCCRWVGLRACMRRACMDAQRDACGAAGPPLPKPAARRDPATCCGACPTALHCCCRTGAPTQNRGCVPVQPSTTPCPCTYMCVACGVCLACRMRTWW